MSALTIDTFAAAQILRKRGFTEDQATGVVEALREIDASSLATKADVLAVEAKIETTSANLKVDLLRWLVVTQIALAGFIFASMKFVK
jgi:predicted DNA-binding transcriptional regulator YafY